MITRNDCLLLLAELQENKNIDPILIKEMTRKTVVSNTVDISVLDFINKARQLDLSKFYEQLRANYNHKKSKLYKNIVKEIDEPEEVLTTLSALLTQILLFSKHCDDKELFLKHSRAEEITIVLKEYFKNYDIKRCIQLLRLIKADLKCLENSIRKIV